MVNAKRWHPEEFVPSSFKISTKDRPFFAICADGSIPTAIDQNQPTLCFEHTYELNSPTGSSYNVVCNVLALALHVPCRHLRGGYELLVPKVVKDIDGGEGLVKRHGQRKGPPLVQLLGG
jgi:hypothetical protein